MSIINNTRCPNNTDSDDSEIEQADGHISLEEISSDSEAEAAQQKGEFYWGSGVIAQSVTISSSVLNIFVSLPYKAAVCK